MRNIFLYICTVDPFICPYHPLAASSRTRSTYKNTSDYQREGFDPGRKHHPCRSYGRGKHRLSTFWIVDSCPGPEIELNAPFLSDRAAESVERPHDTWLHHARPQQSFLKGKQRQISTRDTQSGTLEYDSEGLGRRSRNSRGSTSSTLAGNQPSTGEPYESAGSTEPRGYTDKEVVTATDLKSRRSLDLGEGSSRRSSGRGREGLDFQQLEDQSLNARLDELDKRIRELNKGQLVKDEKTLARRKKAASDPPESRASTGTNSATPRKRSRSLHESTEGGQDSAKGADGKFVNKRKEATSDSKGKNTKYALVRKSKSRGFHRVEREVEGTWPEIVVSCDDQVTADEATDA